MSQAGYERHNVQKLVFRIRFTRLDNHRRYFRLYYVDWNPTHDTLGRRYYSGAREAKLQHRQWSNQWLHCKTDIIETEFLCIEQYDPSVDMEEF